MATDNQHSRLTRRAFLHRLGAGGGGLLVLAACGDAGEDPQLLFTTTSTAAPASTTTFEPFVLSTTTQPPVTTEPPPTTTTTAEPPASTVPDDALTWERVNLGGVSAYILIRNGEAAIVDTGTAGAADSIETTLSLAGLSWSDVGHVIITHLHSDHAGSMFDVMERAEGATGYAGAADIPAINAPRPITPAADGDFIFDLRIIGTPGHTPGHISVLDESAGVLVAGDAIVGSPLAGPTPRFTSNLALANDSVAVLGQFTYETILFGHGEPITVGGSASVAALAATL